MLGLAQLDPQLLDAFTVYSTCSPLILPEFAQPLVRSALQIRAHSQREPLNQQPIHAGSGGLGPVSLAGQVARIHACTANDVPTLCRVAVVRLTDQPHKPFLVYAWYTDWLSNEVAE